MKTLRALFWGCVTGAALAYVFAPRRVDLLRGAYGRVSGQPGSATPTATGANAGVLSTPTSTGRMPLADGSGGTVSTQVPPAAPLDAANGQTATAGTAAYIGNTHTRVYHIASDSNLPSEENRAYFTSAADAEAAGYRASGQISAV